MTDQKLSRREKRAQAKRKKQMQSVGIMIIGVLIIVAAFVLISLSSSRVNAAEAWDYQNVDGKNMGDPNAPVVIVEYFSFACSHCRNYSEGSLRPIIETYVNTGQVYYVSKNFNNPTDAAGIAAQAAYCAAEQDKYWQMHDIIFANFSSTGYTTSELEKMAKAIDLDMDAYDQCFSSPEIVSAVQADADEGRAVGVTGTPNFLINGNLAVLGNAPFENFQAEIEAALLAAGN